MSLKTLGCYKYPVFILHDHFHSILIIRINGSESKFKRFLNTERKKSHGGLGRYFTERLPAARGGWSLKHVSLSWFRIGFGTK